MDAATLGGVGLLLSNTVLLIRLSFAFGKAAGRHEEFCIETERRLKRLEELTDRSGRLMGGGSSLT